MMAYDVRSTQPGLHIPSEGALSARSIETSVLHGTYEEIKIGNENNGSKTSRGDGQDQPRFGTMNELSHGHQDSIISSAEKRRGNETMIFSPGTEEQKRVGIQELREHTSAGSVKRKK